MPRNTCRTCRAENLLSAVVCVACGTMFEDHDAAATSTIETGAPWTPPMPVRPVAARNQPPVLSIVGNPAKERIPPRPD